MRAWLGIALLAASWLLGLSYYHQANWWAWAVAVAAGTALLIGFVRRMPGRVTSVVAAVLLQPAVWLAPWPYRAAPLLITLGLLAHLPSFPRRWPRAIGSAAVAAGVVLLGQSLAMVGYASLTARSHELPWPLPSLVGAVASLLGADVAVDGSRLALWSMREVHNLGATWELLLDPPTLCFLVGGVVVLSLQWWARSSPQCRRAPALLKGTAALVVAVLAWLPVRAGLQIALLLHRALRTDYDAPLDLIGQLWSPWLHLLLLVPPVLLAWRFARLPAATDIEPTAAPPTWRRPLAAVLAGVSVGVLSAAVFWDPVGTRKDGRVLVDEHHSTWEPTEKPYDTKWYGHDSGYNYACIYDYCSRFYDMGRLKAPIDDAALSQCDVLVLKVPTSPYASDEIAAIRRFVQRGGGLVLIGEHTDVFGTGRHLNAVARSFGFAFRYDCCFGIDSFFDDHYPPRLVPHPITQGMPPFEFAVSCSIAPGLSRGRAAIVGTGLRNLTADYHVSNFYPQAENKAHMRYGAFVQLLATRHGAGRVVAFGDSTVFSNFSTFEPGKPELWLGMIEWANHRGGISPRVWLALLGAVGLAGALFLARRWDGAWVLLLAAGVCGWAVAVVGVRAAHRAAMPPPKAARPMTLVTIDRTVCGSHLPKSGFVAGNAGEFGIFERWILRLGYFTSRRSDAAALEGDLLVFFRPDLPISDKFREAFGRYVADGGKALILDAPDNTKSTANSLLWPFGLKIDRQTKLDGLLAVPQGWPSVPVASAARVTGGTPLARLKGEPVAATVRHGKGTVTVVAFASRFADTRMGVTGDIEPGPDLQKVFDLQFTLLRTIISDQIDMRTPRAD